MNDGFIVKDDENGITHYVNPKFEKIFDGTEQVDISNEILYHPSEEEISQNQILHRVFIAKKYLTETDWYVTRFSENGTPIPEDVLTKRNQARIDASN